MRSFLLIALLSLFLGACSSNPEVVETVSVQDEPQQVASSDDRASDGGRPQVDNETPVRVQKSTIRTRQGQRWELEADEIDWMDSRQFAKAYDVTWYLVDEDGEKTVRVDAPAADVDMEGQVVTFIGQVLASRLDSEETLTVEHLIYNGEDRMFYGSQGVVWKREGLTLNGQTLTATAELDKVQLKGQVQGQSRGRLNRVGRAPRPEQASE